MSWMMYISKNFFPKYLSTTMWLTENNHKTCCKWPFYSITLQSAMQCVFNRAWQCQQLSGNLPYPLASVVGKCKGGRTVATDRDVTENNYVQATECKQRGPWLLTHINKWNVESVIAGVRVGEKRLDGADALRNKNQSIVSLWFRQKTNYRPFNLLWRDGAALLSFVFVPKFYVLPIPVQQTHIQISFNCPPALGELWGKASYRQVLEPASTLSPGNCESTIRFWV